MKKKKRLAEPKLVTAPKMTKDPLTPPAMTHLSPQSHHPNTHHAAPTTDREIARPMPKFDHMKGEVSVRNLVWKQGGKQFQPWRSEHKIHIPTLQAHQS